MGQSGVSLYSVATGAATGNQAVWEFRLKESLVDTVRIHSYTHRQPPVVNIHYYYYHPY